MSKKRAEAAKASQEFWARLEKENAITTIIKKYDREGNQKLNKQELAVMLQDLAGGTAPTDEETSFVMHVADVTDKKIDGFIDRNELEAAIQIWKNYLVNKADIEEKFAKYDTNHSGKLELDQLAALLTDLNDGKPPKDEEVKAVMGDADGIAGEKTGGVNKMELTSAISIWYGYVDEHQKCCTLM